MDTPPWIALSDDQLMETRISALRLTLVGTPLETLIQQLYAELGAKGLLFNPPCFVGDEWFCPIGIPAIFIPFYLTHERLREIERRIMLEVEGETSEWFMQLIRHEAAHAYSYAFRLYRKKKWQACFGLASQEQLDTYRPTGFWTPLIQAGGGFRWFNPLSLGRLVYRDHRKLLVCDREHGFIGGFNVGSQYCGDGITRGWRDLGFRVSGELARVLAESFDIFFARAESRHKRFQRLRSSATETTATGAEWRLLLTRPGLHQSDLRKSLAQDLAMAREVRIMSAYFLPTWRLRKDIRRVAQNGGSVQLILAGKSDVRLSKLASRRLYSQMLRAGVEVHEYMPQVLHAKLFIVDDVVYVGSANFDTRSLVINYELQVRLSEQRVADEAKQIFRDDLAHCRRIDALSWRHSRGFFEKLMESWAYFVLARIDPYIARRQLKRLQ